MPEVVDLLLLPFLVILIHQISRRRHHYPNRVVLRKPNARILRIKLGPCHLYQPLSTLNLDF